MAAPPVTRDPKRSGPVASSATTSTMTSRGPSEVTTRPAAQIDDV